VTVRYLSRRIGRSQNGMARGSSVPLPRPVPGSGGAAGLRSVAGRWRGPAPALVPVPAPVLALVPDQPDEAGLFGQAGALLPLVLLPLAPLPRLGAPLDVARDRAGGEPAAAERPAPRDQLVAAPAGLLPPLPVLGGRSSGGAARAPL
jgi:hypothetical protein